MFFLFSLYANCQHFVQAFFTSEHTDGGDGTENLIVYLSQLLESGVIEDQELLLFTRSLQRGKLVNPISEEKASIDIASHIHYLAIQRYLSLAMNMGRLQSWSQDISKNRQLQRQHREAAQNSTSAIYSPKYLLSLGELEKLSTSEHLKKFMDAFSFMRSKNPRLTLTKMITDLLKLDPDWIIPVGVNSYFEKILDRIGRRKTEKTIFILDMEGDNLAFTRFFKNDDYIEFFEWLEEYGAHPPKSTGPKGKGAIVGQLLSQVELLPPSLMFQLEENGRNTNRLFPHVKIQRRKNSGPIIEIPLNRFFNLHQEKALGYINVIDAFRNAFSSDRMNRYTYIHYYDELKKFDPDCVKVLPPDLLILLEFLKIVDDGYSFKRGHSVASENKRKDQFLRIFATVKDVYPDFLLTDMIETLWNLYKNDMPAIEQLLPEKINSYYNDILERMYVGQMNFGTVPVKILEEGEALEWLFERDYKTFFRLLEVWDRDRKPLQVIIRRPRYHSGRDLFLHVMLQKGVRLPPSFIYQIDHPSDLFKFGRMTLNRFFDLKEESYFAYTNLLSVFTTIFHGDNGLAFLPFFRELKRFDWDIDNKLPPDIIHTIKNLE